MTENFSHFDAAEYLETEEDIAAFLAEASEGGDANSIALALGAVARARNISQLARTTGMTRTGLYRALAPGGNPSLDTVIKVASALGFELALKPKADAKPAPERSVRGRKKVAEMA